MNTIGLKLWSINTDYYYDEAKKLYQENIFDYIELYVVPNTLHTIEKWKSLDIPYILHNAHFRHGFNLAEKSKKEENLKIYEETKIFADELNAEYIIFHPGIGGNIEESVKQLSSFKEKRALIENKPAIVASPKLQNVLCRGADVKEISQLMQETGCGFCLDIGHALCAANYFEKESLRLLKDFISLSPTLYHLSDVDDVHSCYDSHINIAKGKLDFEQVIQIIPKNAIISLETNKNYEKSLIDFKDDVYNFRKIEATLMR